MRDRDDGFEDVYEGKFDLGDVEEFDFPHGVDPADSRVLDEYVENVDPEDVDVDSLVDVGVSYVQINRNEQAIETLERAISFDRDNQEAWVNKGYAHAALGEWDQAIGAQKEAVAIDDDSRMAAKALVNLAYAEHEAARGDPLEHIEKALDIDERLPEAWYNRAFFLNERGQNERALRAIENAVSLGYRGVEVLEEKARALEGVGELEEAEKAREEARMMQEEELKEQEFGGGHGGTGAGGSGGGGGLRER